MTNTIDEKIKEIDIKQIWYEQRDSNRTAKKRDEKKQNVLTISSGLI